jgi:hypothetical protein
MPEDVVCARIQLQPGSLSRVQEWAEHLRTHRDEALQTLAAEGVTVESVFLDSGAEGDFLVYYMRSGSQQLAQEVAARSVAAIDAHHSAFKRDTWAQVRRLDLLLDLARTS